MSKQNKVKLSGLWSRTDKDGNLMLSAKLNGNYIQIFKNTYKEKDSEPDFIMYLSEPIEGNNYGTDFIEKK